MTALPQLTGTNKAWLLQLPERASRVLDELVDAAADCDDFYCTQDSAEHQEAILAAIQLLAEIRDRNLTGG